MRTLSTRSRLRQALMIAVLLHCQTTYAASFVYEGRLEDRGTPAHGRYDIQLSVFGESESGAMLGAPIEFPAVEVVEGRFRLDFDVPLAASQSAWIALAVRDAGMARFTAIVGRTKATQAAVTIGACWSTVGDAGSDPATHFLGTTDAQPLVLRTANVQSLRIEPSAELFAGAPVSANFIAGSSANQVVSGVRGATISGGGAPDDGDPNFSVARPNRVTDHYGSVGGGFDNQAGDGASTVGNKSFATVGGGLRNMAGGDSSVVAGGTENIATGSSSSVSGGTGNTASAAESSVGGGYYNSASGAWSSVGGGNSNTASGAYSFSSGLQNCAGGQFSFALGARAKVRPGTASGAVGSGCNGVPPSGDGGGDSGTFVWADEDGTPFTSTGDNQFLVRAAGGVGINGAPPSGSANELNIFATAPFGGYANLFMRQLDGDRGGILVSAGDASSNTNNAGFYIDQFKPDGINPGQVRRLELDTSGRLRVFVDNPIKPTAGSWSAPSDARLKHHVVPLRGALERLLALRGVSYEYNADAPSAYFTPGTHMGFIAQDVQKVFPSWVSSDASGYLMLGPQGFEAIAVEALRELRGESALIDAAQTNELRSLERRNQVLEDQVAQLRAGNREIRRELVELRALIQATRREQR